MEWISVEIKLPECKIHSHDTKTKHNWVKSENVLVLMQHIEGNYTTTNIARLIDNSIWIYGSDVFTIAMGDYKVTHWMPLPTFEDANKTFIYNGEEYKVPNINRSYIIENIVPINETIDESIIRMRYYQHKNIIPLSFFLPPKTIEDKEDNKYELVCVTVNENYDVTPYYKKIKPEK